MIRRPPRSTLSSSSAASDVYKRQYQRRVRGAERNVAMAKCHITSNMNQRLEEASELIRRVLDTTKHPNLCENVSHTYSDKYLLAELLTNTAIASQINCLSELGMTSDALATLVGWAQDRAVTLSFLCTRRCALNREERRDVESTSRHVTEVVGTSGASGSITHKSVTTVVDFFWDFNASWEVAAYAGTGDDSIRLMSRESRGEVKTSSEYPPYPDVVIESPVEASISFLLSKVAGDMSEIRFRIDREHKDTHTPRRNREVEEAVGSLGRLAEWADAVQRYLIHNLGRVQVVNAVSLDLSQINADGLVSPALPRFEEREATAIEPAAGESATAGIRVAQHASPSQALLAASDVNQLLAEERKAMVRKRTAIEETSPQRTELLSAVEAWWGVVCLHMAAAHRQYCESIEYIESMLRAQLIQAIGKVVTPDDFEEYMRFHSNKIFNQAFRPTPCSYSIRKSPAHSPQGTISIESQPAQSDRIRLPIATSVSHSRHGAPMGIRLSGSTVISIGGGLVVPCPTAH
eukprot:TRINITY_DN13566_c0_g1_i4.p1 TRINITY_DN13566_c0_g1~~TRINITY_DN13566_c0_g1_i4.p1  ORF type:complete len:521 (+),score=108.87 TRINITY_DN13566_c0_g1_i4:147-1709(+)